MVNSKPNFSNIVCSKFCAACEPASTIFDLSHVTLQTRCAPKWRVATRAHLCSSAARSTSKHVAALYSLDARSLERPAGVLRIALRELQIIVDIFQDLA